MNIQAPVSSIMSTDLMVVQSDHKVVIVRDIMEINEIHHVPVVNFNKIVGLISKSDLLHFLKGIATTKHSNLETKTFILFFVLHQVESNHD